MSILTRDEVLATLCELATSVMIEKFGGNVPADCFCAERPLRDINDYQFDTEVMDYIRVAVAQRIVREEDEAIKLAAQAQAKAN